MSARLDHVTAVGLADALALYLDKKKDIQGEQGIFEIRALLKDVSEYLNANDSVVSYACDVVVDAAGLGATTSVLARTARDELDRRGRELVDAAVAAGIVDLVDADADTAAGAVLKALNEYDYANKDTTVRHMMIFVREYLVPYESLDWVDVLAAFTGAISDRLGRHG